MAGSGGEVTYQGYLKLPELLSLQAPLSQPEHPEELHFIVVHQATELWFKLILHQLERAIAALDAADASGAGALMRRVNGALDLCVDHVRSLHDMPPWSFHEFRGCLGGASAVQSMQFRELELLSGLRTPDYLASLERPLPPALTTRIEQRSLADAHRDAARELGIGDWADFYAAPGAHIDFYILCELLVDYDVRWGRWREEHIVLVERMLGARAYGTGGTAAMSFLRRTSHRRFFPHLWKARDELCLRGGGELVRSPR